MSLEERLASIREGATRRIPPDQATIMERATEDLRRSGILERVTKIGDRLPEFALKNAFGEEVRSADLLNRWPLVLTVFRGSW
jgi:hypothetical protein